MNRKVIYLACPYSHVNDEVVEDRVRNFCIVAAELESSGEAHVVSAMLNHLILRYAELPKDWNFWKSYSETMIERADEVVVLKLEGWNNSTGVAGEIEHAIKIGKPVRYIEF